MKRIVFLLFVIVLLTCIITKNTEYLIPDKAIRIRVIANSNSLNDQKNKSDIKNSINDLLYPKLNNINNYEDATNIIKNSIPEIKNVVNKYTDDYEINYGENYFPDKKYKGINYKEGNYESIIIKLGEGKGENFWCVLFPPLCMIDEQKLDNNTYKLFVSEIINKLK